MLPDESPKPLDPFGLGPAALEVAKALGGDPKAFIAAQTQFAEAWTTIAAQALTTIEHGAEPAAPAPAVIAAPSGDARWKHVAWTQSPIFDAMKQGYLLASKAMLDAIDQAPDVDAETKRRVRFFAKQFCDAMSPTNFAAFNPAVIEETLRSSGSNLQRGLHNLLEDARDNAGRPALVDKAAFEVGVNVAQSKGSVVFRNELIELIQYDPTTVQVHERPLVIVPPWINKFYILDLQPANSFIKYAADSGFTTFVVSWRNPDASLAHLDMADYMERGALTAARVAAQIVGSSTVNLIGYCIGGTLTAMLLAYLARTKQRLVKAVTFFAAMTDFANPGDLGAFISEESVGYIESLMKEKGYLDGSQMADTFNMLRANDLIWNVAVNRYLLGKDAPAFDLLFWNSDATRLPRAMHSYYLRNMYLENKLAKADALKVHGVGIDLGRIRNDVYCVATADDHIAPWRSVYRMTQSFGGKTEFRLGHSGHIAGIINPPAGKKGSWWSAPSNPPDADAWRTGAVEHAGSWWPDWSDWLGSRSGSEKPAPERAGSDEFPPLSPAPGTYALER